MLNFISDKKNCTGCGACYSICPVKCITMKEDAEGFLYPSASEACINCGLCKRICPVVQSLNKELGLQKAIGFCTSDYNLWKCSSSGGAFSEIVKYWSDNSTIVFGAAWVGKEVHHIEVPSNNISPIRKSKYISSSTQNTFIKAKEYLNQGKKVIYSGCPCQIAGLKSFLKKDYENLLTIDLICHGQGSKFVFAECLKDTENLIGANVLKYEFRSKRNVFETEYLSKVTTNKGVFYLFSERYTQLFLGLKCVRPSCGSNCIFNSKIRPGDITLADLKCADTVNPCLVGSKYNYSTIVANSVKGRKIVDFLSRFSKSFPIDIDTIIKTNPNFGIKRGNTTDMRDAFFKAFIDDPRVTILMNTTPTIIYTRSLLWRFYDSLPHFIRRFIINLYRKIKRK